jgi:N-acetylglutamate synthase-like GNAT family acetyltransferase
VSSTPTNSYEITTDVSRMDVDAIHAYLTRAYWSVGVPKAIVERAIAHSLCVGVLHDGAQVGFARMVTDRATFAYLADVYILEAHRRRGLSKRLMETIMAHPDVQGLRRMLLATRDAHGLYAQYGFVPLAAPDRFMERHDPTVYQRGDRETGTR